MELKSPSRYLWKSLRCANTIQYHLPLLAAAVILILWTTLFFRPISALFGHIVNPQYRLIMITFTAILFLISFQFYRDCARFGLSIAHERRHLSVILVALFSLLHLLNTRYIQLDLVSQASFIGGLYSLRILFHPRIPIALTIIPFLTLIAALPYATQVNSLFGFPLRMLIADILRTQLSLFGIDSLTSETIISIDNRLADIATACSGVKGLWAANLCFFVMVWIHDRAFSPRLCLNYILYFVAVFVLNVIRIGGLVVLYTIFQQRALADLFHLPLGILLFVMPTLFLLFLLRTTHRIAHSPATEQPRQIDVGLHAWFIIAAIIVCAIFLNPQPKVSPITTTEITIPSSERVTISRLPLCAEELETFSTFPIISYSKNRFTTADLSGSFILTESENWKSHHDQQRCLKALGLHSETVRRVSLTGSQSVNRMVFDTQRLQAVTWFQSDKCLTGDYSKRIWHHFLGDQKRWISVSILFSCKAPVSDQVILEFIDWLSLKIESILHEESHALH